MADFTDDRDGEFIVEDVKGMRLPLYAWKKRHFELDGIAINEI